MASQVYGFAIVQGSPAQGPGAASWAGVRRLSSPALSCEHAQELVLIQNTEGPLSWTWEAGALLC